MYPTVPGEPRDGVKNMQRDEYRGNKNAKRDDLKKQKKGDTNKGMTMVYKSISYRSESPEGQAKKGKKGE